MREEKHKKREKNNKIIRISEKSLGIILLTVDYQEVYNTYKYIV